MTQPDENSSTKNGGRLDVHRLLDIAGVVLLFPALAVVLVPAMLAVRLTSPGPVFFRQTRYGLNKQRFRIYKLRTMTVTEDGAAFRQARQGDARITSVGGFLRRTSIDELPQIINVLKGDMALVGPRPHPTQLDDDFAPLIEGYELRFGARPGITGLAQVRGQRGPTETVEIMRARVTSDIEYVRTRSLALDIRIIVATVWVVLSGRNAF